jgi:DNA polymerase-3 subunit delta'
MRCNELRSKVVPNTDLPARFFAMPLPPLIGHERVKTSLAGALASAKLPQALLLAGPRGVGKQRLALWLAQLIHCDAPRGAEPCGECRPCRLVLSLQHPDVHWFVPIELSKRGGSASTGDADKQIELAAEALAEEMASRREQPFYAPVVGLASHPVASIRLLLKRLALTPAMGRRKVFILGDAERLIPQLGTEVAANALLKALEEPPADSVIILTASDQNALLPTVLSRIVLVRVARIADSDVTAFAQQRLGMTNQAELAQRVTAAEGSIGKLFATAPVRSASGSISGGVDQAERFLNAPWLFALGQVPFQARGGFTDMLDALASRLRSEAKRGVDTEKLVEAIAFVLDARDLAQGNVNPQLLAAVLAEDLHARRVS